jgi:hypothetical protein
MVMVPRAWRIQTARTAHVQALWQRKPWDAYTDGALVPAKGWEDKPVEDYDQDYFDSLGPLDLDPNTFVGMESAHGVTTPKAARRALKRYAKSKTLIGQIAGLLEHAYPTDHQDYLPFYENGKRDEFLARRGQISENLEDAIRGKFSLCALNLLFKDHLFSEPEFEDWTQLDCSMTNLCIQATNSVHTDLIASLRFLKSIELLWIIIASWIKVVLKRIETFLRLEAERYVKPPPLIVFPQIQPNAPALI